MHMRKKKWARPELDACSYYLAQPKEWMGKWRSLFPKNQPFYVELGCGKGVSTAQMAHENQDVNYLAIDINPDVLGCTRRNIESAYGEDPVDNIRITRHDIEHLDWILCGEDQVERIIISFCNPWNLRAKHHKRRLTHPRQLMQYRSMMTEDGEIWFKTDDKQLFHDSLKYFEACGFDSIYMTEDLHDSGFSPNYVSEHEKKYTEQGMPIYFGIFCRNQEEVTFNPVKWRAWGMLEDDESLAEDKEA